MYEDASKHLKIQKIKKLAGILLIALVIGVGIFNLSSVTTKNQRLLENEDWVIGKNILRYEIKTQIEKKEIPFGTVTRGVKNTTNYISKIISEGVCGEELVAYKTTYLNGKEINKELIGEVVSREAQDEIVEKLARTATNAYVSRSSYEARKDGAPETYKKVINMKATAYCLCTKCCGKSPSNPGYGMTASGLRIVPNTGMKVIAVDTSVIPLGTWVYVEGLNGAPDYGYAIAADTGSAIKNNKIDLYVETHNEAWNWGTKNVKVYIVE